MFKKTISLILSLSLIITQPIFAQGLSQLNLAKYLGQMPILATDTFRPTQLRYFSYDNLNNSYKILLDKGDIKDNQLKEEAKELMDYFLIGLALPNDTFWVNLRPDSPDNIIDSKLEKTDLGRILLESDLQLKKDTAGMTSPQTPEGKAYWDKLYKKAGELFGTENIAIPTLTRPWIVPGEIIVRESQSSAYIYKATLKVMLEDDYLKNSSNSINSNNSTDYSFSDPRLKELNEYSTQIIRETIIPKLTQDVNSSKRYAQLRQVYYSLVLSRWFKRRFSKDRDGSSNEITLFKNRPLNKSIDSGDLTGLTSKGPWSKDYYFNEYKKSFQQGEYNLKEPVYSPYGQSIRAYMSGGFTAIDMNISGPGIKAETAGSPAEQQLLNKKNVVVINDKLEIVNLSQPPLILSASPVIASYERDNPKNSVARAYKYAFHNDMISYNEYGVIAEVFRYNPMLAAYRLGRIIKNKIDSYQIKKDLKINNFSGEYDYGFISDAKEIDGWLRWLTSNDFSGIRKSVDDALGNISSMLPQGSSLKDFIDERRNNIENISDSYISIIEILSLAIDTLNKELPIAEINRGYSNSDLKAAESELRKMLSIAITNTVISKIYTIPGFDKQISLEIDLYVNDFKYAINKIRLYMSDYEYVILNKALENLPGQRKDYFKGNANVVPAGKLLMLELGKSMNELDSELQAVKDKSGLSHFEWLESAVDLIFFPAYLRYLRHRKELLGALVGMQDKIDEIKKNYNILVDAGDNFGRSIDALMGSSEDLRDTLSRVRDYLNKHFSKFQGNKLKVLEGNYELVGDNYLVSGKDTLRTDFPKRYENLYDAAYRAFLALKEYNDCREILKNAWVTYKARPSNVSSSLTIQEMRELGLTPARDFIVSKIADVQWRGFNDKKYLISVLEACKSYMLEFPGKYIEAAKIKISKKEVKEITETLSLYFNPRFTDRIENIAVAAGYLSERMKNKFKEDEIAQDFESLGKEINNIVKLLNKSEKQAQAVIPDSTASREKVLEAKNVIVKFFNSVKDKNEAYQGYINASADNIGILLEASKEAVKLMQAGSNRLFKDEILPFEAAQPDTFDLEKMASIESFLEQLHKDSSSSAMAEGHIINDKVRKKIENIKYALKMFPFKALEFTRDSKFKKELEGLHQEVNKKIMSAREANDIIGVSEALKEFYAAAAGFQFQESSVMPEISQRLAELDELKSIVNAVVEKVKILMELDITKLEEVMLYREDEDVDVDFTKFESIIEELSLNNLKLAASEMKYLFGRHQPNGYDEYGRKWASIINELRIFDLPVASSALAVAEMRRQIENILDKLPDSRMAKYCKEIISSIKEMEKLVKSVEKIIIEIGEYAKQKRDESIEDVRQDNLEASNESFRESQESLLVKEQLESLITPEGKKEADDDGSVSSALTPQEIKEQAIKGLEESSPSFQAYRRKYGPTPANRIDYYDNDLNKAYSREKVLRLLENEILFLKKIIEVKPGDIVVLDQEPLVTIEAQRILVIFNGLIKELSSTALQASVNEFKDFKDEYASSRQKTVVLNMVNLFEKDFIGNVIIKIVTEVNMGREKFNKVREFEIVTEDFTPDSDKSFKVKAINIENCSKFPFMSDYKLGKELVGDRIGDLMPLNPLSYQTERVDNALESVGYELPFDRVFLRGEEAERHENAVHYVLKVEHRENGIFKLTIHPNLVSKITIKYTPASSNLIAKQKEQSGNPSEFTGGGIDFTDKAMRIGLEPMGSFADLKLVLPEIANVAAIDLDNEFKQIQAMALSGIRPADNRILEFAAACYYRGEFSWRLGEITTCLQQAHFLDERLGKESSQALRLATMLPEAFMLS